MTGPRAPQSTPGQRVPPDPLAVVGVPPVTSTMESESPARVNSHVGALIENLNHSWEK